MSTKEKTYPIKIINDILSELKNNCKTYNIKNIEKILKDAPLHFNPSNKRTKNFNLMTY